MLLLSGSARRRNNFNVNIYTLYDTYSYICTHSHMYIYTTSYACTYIYIYTYSYIYTYMRVLPFYMRRHRFWTHWPHYANPAVCSVRSTAITSQLICFNLHHHHWASGTDFISCTLALVRQSACSEASSTSEGPRPFFSTLTVWGLASTNALPITGCSDTGWQSKLLF